MKTIKIRKTITLLITLLYIFSFACMGNASKDKSAKKAYNLSGKYVLEYSFKTKNEENNFLQKGSVNFWKISQDENKIMVEDVAEGNLKDSTITFNGGPLNFGAGYSMANFKGIANDSTIVGTFSGNYYDAKSGLSKFSSAIFVLRKIK